MADLIRDVITGSVSGGIYALIAAGLVLTYATTGVFNLGYAGIAFSGAYIYFELNTGLGWPQWAAAVVVILGYAPLLGLALEVLIFRRVARASETARVVAAVGVLLAVPALCTYLVGRGIGMFGWSIPTGKDVQLVPGLGPQPRHVYHVYRGAVITSDQLIVIGTAIACVVALTLFLHRTRTGLRMRALADRHELALMRGVDDAGASRWAWVLGSVLAAIAGVVGGPIIRTLDPGSYTLTMFVAIAAAVAGRFRSIPLAFLGAIGVSILSNLVYTYGDFASSIPNFNSAVPFLILIGGLVVLAHTRDRSAGSIAAESPIRNYSADLPAWRRALPSTLATVVLILGVLWFLGPYWLGLTTRGLIFGLILLSFTVVTGLGGMVSLAQGSFVYGAALFAGAMIGHWNLPWFVALVLATLAAMVLGALVALPSLRLGGVALALATLALAFLCAEVLFQIDWLRNGEFGWTISRPALGGIHLDSTRSMAILTLVVLAGVLVLIRNLERSNAGREMIAVRNAPVAAAAVGVSPTVTKLKIFTLSAGIAGIGGVLLVTYDQSITTTSVSPLSGLLWLAAVVLFGVRRPAGAIAGGLMFALFPGLLSGFTLPFDLAHWSGSQAGEVPTILFGLGAIALARQPDGMFQAFARRNFEWRTRRKPPVSALLVSDVTS